MEKHESSRARSLWWGLGGAVGLTIATVLVLAIVSHVQQRNAIRTIEDLGGMVRTESIGPGWARDPAIDHWLLGTAPVTRVRFAGRTLKPAEVEQFLTTLKEFPELRTLRAGFSQVGDDELRRIAELRQLDALDLDRTRITDAGLAELAALSELTWLVLDNTAVTDAGIEHLRPLKKLEMVSLEGTAVTDASLDILASLPNLDRVYLIGAPNITSEGVVEFQRRKPSVRVIR